MGYYINPADESKEEFLDAHGTIIGEDVPWENIPAGYLPVLLVNNGWMTAAAIGYKKDEYTYFSDPADARPRTIYQVKIADLLPVSGDDFRNYAERNNLVEAA